MTAFFFGSFTLPRGVIAITPVSTLNLRMARSVANWRRTVFAAAPAATHAFTSA
ncbi:MAG TPA: hypothetical protein VHD87_17540 [Acidimicrobiales bacterium]|nr:hypothetical protein [Acidimicrobiales bacterium]